MRTLELILLVAALASANAQESCSASVFATLYLRCDGDEVGDPRGANVCTNQKQLEVGQILSFKVTVSNDCSLNGGGVEAAVGNGQHLDVYYACAQGSECKTADDIYDGIFEEPVFYPKGPGITAGDVTVESTPDTFVRIKFNRQINVVSYRTDPDTPEVEIGTLVATAAKRPPGDPTPSYLFRPHILASSQFLQITDNRCNSNSATTTSSSTGGFLDTGPLPTPAPTESPTESPTADEIASSTPTASPTELPIDPTASPTESPTVPPVDIWPRVYFRSEVGPVVKFTLRINPTPVSVGSSDPVVALASDPDDVNALPCPTGPQGYPADEEYSSSAVFKAAQTSDETWSVRRISATEIEYTATSDESGSIPTTSWSRPAHENDFRLFIHLPLVMLDPSGELGDAPFCLDVESQFYTRDETSGELVLATFQRVKRPIDGLPTGELPECSHHYFELPRGGSGDEGDEGDSSDGDADDDDGGQGRGGDDDADDDDYLDPSSPSTPSPAPSPTP